MIEILQVVPHFLPQVSGVGDYALLLARELRARHDLNSTFVVTDPKWDGPSQIDGFEVVKLEFQRADALASTFQSVPRAKPTLLVHYVGYGYQKRGCPIWLLQGLENLRKTWNVRLVTMFHELFACGPPWKSSFWTAPLQQLLVARLARSSDACITNRARSRSFLARVASRHRDQVPVLPVFSNFGEPATVPRLAGRPAQAIFVEAFGRSVKNAISGWRAIKGMCCRAEIEKLTIIGSGKSRPLEVMGMEVETRSHLTAGEASELLVRARLGFLDYFDGYLGKSGFFAAFCAYGVAPVLLAPNSSGDDGLFDKHQFLVAELQSRSLALPEQQAVADAARVWYSSHSLARAAEAFAGAVKGTQLIERLAHRSPITSGPAGLAVDQR